MLWYVERRIMAPRGKSKQAMTESGQRPQWPSDLAGEETLQAPPEILPPPYDPGSSASAPTVTDAAFGRTVQPAGARIQRGEALDLLARLKTTLVAGSLIAFGVFAGLVATHITGVTARAASSNNGSAGSQATPTPPTHSDDGGFFNNGPNSGFGVGPPGPQGPSSGTTVS
jgi:hypothetical protein